MDIWNRPADLPEIDTPERAQCRATRCVKGEIAPYVLLPGDPGRAAHIAKNWFDDAQLVMMNREFHSYTGSYKGVPVSVISTGLGAPGAVMVTQDLPKLGVKAAIRVGTAGGASEAVKPGDLVIAEGAVRDEGVSYKFMPANYPAVADHGLVAGMCAAAKSQGSPYHTGIIHTSDAFSSPGLAVERDLYAEANVLAFEMEAAAILVVARTLGLPAGCIVAVDGYVRNVAGGDFTPDAERRNRAVEAGIKIALETMVARAANEI